MPHWGSGFPFKSWYEHRITVQHVISLYRRRFPWADVSTGTYGVTMFPDQILLTVISSCSFHVGIMHCNEYFIKSCHFCVLVHAVARSLSCEFVLTLHTVKRFLLYWCSLRLCVFARCIVALLFISWLIVWCIVALLFISWLIVWCRVALLFISWLIVRCMVSLLFISWLIVRCIYSGSLVHCMAHCLMYSGSLA
jgi:hypothetical protein